MTVEEAQNNTTTETNELKETIPTEESAESEKWQKIVIEYAVKALDEKEQKKINVDKSYIESMYGDETGEEYYIVHLDSDNCYYNITITAAMTKVIKTEKFDK